MLDSAQYHTAPSKKKSAKTWIRAVSYCGESTNEIGGKSSAQYDSAQSLTPRSMILWGVNFGKLEHLGEISTKIKTILTHYSVAQAGSNYEKNRLKILVDCPFKYDSENSNDSAQ